MSALTFDQKQHKQCQESNKCSSCHYVNQTSIKEYKSCCTFPGQLIFSKNKCLTHKSISTTQENKQC